MPFYDYECSACNNKIIDVFQSMSDTPLVHCDVCGADALVRCIYAPMSATAKCRTLGALADRNAASMSSDQKKVIAEQQKTARDEVLFKKMPEGLERMEKPKGHKQPWYKKYQTVSDAKIRKMTDAQKIRYIKTGKG